MAESFFRTYIRDDGETEVTVEIAVSAWGCEAQTYGPPDSCDPGEAMECEIIDCWLTEDDNKADSPRVMLTDVERQRMALAFCENPPEKEFLDYD